MESLHVACADIGSIANNNFGWASVKADDPGTTANEGDDIGRLVDHLAELLEAQKPVSFGLECPLFVPIPKEATKLGKARAGDAARAWSTAAGAAVLATGIAQTHWILEKLGEKLTTRPPVTLNWSQFQGNGAGLHLWEAFVSGSAKSNAQKGAHIADAKKAAGLLIEQLEGPGIPDSQGDDPEVASLIGFALLRTRWTEDNGVLSQPCYIAKPSGSQ
jgi:hypothetical protein